MNDLRFAFRQLLKNPGFTAVAVLKLVLDIGANNRDLKPIPVEADRHPDSVGTKAKLAVAQAGTDLRDALGAMPQAKPGHHEEVVVRFSGLRKRPPWIWSCLSFW